MSLTRIAEGMWEAQTDVAFAGVPMTARTTLVRIEGGLFVCSPGGLTDELRRAIDELGEPRALVAPNRFHHLFLNEWRARYPDAAVSIPRGLAKKRPDLAGAALFGDEGADAGWRGEIDHLPMRGVPFVDEVWFFHRATRTLIDTDLMHNVQRDDRMIARAAWRLVGGWQKFGPSLLERIVTKDRAALRECVERALEWPFERVVVAHGEILAAKDAKDIVRKSWRYLLG